MAVQLAVADALERGCADLRKRAGEDARREALFLLAGVLDLAPGRLALVRDRVLEPLELEEYLSRLARRAAGEPLQYIEGRAAFRQLDLRVDSSVLIPRPETEQLVDRVLQWSEGKQGLTALDLGTGSGAIAISLAQEGPFDRVVAVDISPKALNVARENTAEAGVAERIDLRLGSLYGALRPDERFHAIVSNPPYIASNEAASLPEEVREWEPGLALYAGATGLEFIEEIIAGAPPRTLAGGLLALELAPAVAGAAAARVLDDPRYGDPRVLNDLAGHQRILLAELKHES
jgi:release factor glutamine methyltransferase